MTEIKFRLQIPTLPNFITFETPPGRKQDGFRENSTIAIEDLPNETLIALADEWKEALIRHADRKRKAKS